MTKQICCRNLKLLLAAIGLLMFSHFQGPLEHFIGAFYLFFAQDALPHHPPQLTAGHQKNRQGKVAGRWDSGDFPAADRVEWFG